MTNRIGRLIAPAALAASLIAGAARAQTPADLNVAGRGTELGGAVGAATTSSDTGLVLTGTADWSITRWVALEAAGGWFDRGTGLNAVSADVGVLVNLVPKRRTTPYVGLAFGLHRATIDGDAAALPAFYERRRQRDANVGAMPRTFTDPAWRVSAGVDIIRHRTMSIRPEAAVLLIHRGSATQTIATCAIRLGFVFEDHPVTPATR